MKSLRALVLSLCVSVAAGTAQSEPSPYTGHQERQIKALSDDEIQGFLAGRGMGFALAAELNEYPGPKHVLELASDLQLEKTQVEQTEVAFDAMHREAVRLGAELIEKEKQLDELFAQARANETLLQDLVGEIGRVRGKLRFAHLRAHLQMREILSDEQIHAYNRLRGYRSHQESGENCPHGLK